jgi:transcriptional regulator with XRE-family HTH domain
MSPADQFAAMIAGLESSGLSRSEIAEQAHLSRSTVWRLAEGMAREPTHESFVKVSRLAEKVVRSGRGPA